MNINAPVITDGNGREVPNALTPAQIAAIKAIYPEFVSLTDLLDNTIGIVRSLPESKDYEFAFNGNVITDFGFTASGIKNKNLNSAIALAVLLKNSAYDATTDEFQYYTMDALATELMELRALQLLGTEQAAPTVVNTTPGNPAFLSTITPATAFANGSSYFCLIELATPQYVTFSANNTLICPTNGGNVATPLARGRHAIMFTSTGAGNVLLNGVAHSGLYDGDDAAANNIANRVRIWPFSTSHKIGDIGLVRN